MTTGSVFQSKSSSPPILTNSCLRSVTKEKKWQNSWRHPWTLTQPTVNTCRRGEWASSSYIALWIKSPTLPGAAKTRSLWSKSCSSGEGALYAETLLGHDSLFDSRLCVFPYLCPSKPRVPGLTKSGHRATTADGHLLRRQVENAPRVSDARQPLPPHP